MPIDPERRQELVQKIADLQQERALLAAEDAHICVVLEELAREVGWMGPPSTQG